MGNCVVIHIVIALFSMLTISVLAGFGPVKTGTTVGELAKELADLGIFGSKRAIIVRNKSPDWLRIWCSSKDDTTGEKRLDPGETLSFGFKPLVIGGHTVFWCTLDYKGFWARWDVFGSNAPYGSDKKNDKAYVYEVHHDGVYYDDKKVRGLAAGHHRYTLWESYDDDKMPFGSSLNGFVDKDMCNNVPNFMEQTTSAVTLCDDSCITLYAGLHCKGQTSKLQAPSEGCSHFYLTFFNDRTKSLKGC